MLLVTRGKTAGRELRKSSPLENRQIPVTVLNRGLTKEGTGDFEGASLKGKAGFGAAASPPQNPFLPGERLPAPRRYASSTQTEAGTRK